MAALSKKAPVPAVRKQAAPPAALGDYSAEADEGFEEATSAAYTIPRIYLLQPLSPAVQKGDPTTYVDGAEAGMFLNTVGKEVHRSLIICPVLFRQTWVEWRPERGGFVAEHPSPNPQWTRDGGRGPMITAEGNIVNDTRNFFCLYTDGDNPAEPKPVVISLTSTQIRRAGDLMTVMKNKRGRDVHNRPFTLPMYANLFRVTADLNKNDQGSWYGWVFTDTGRLVPRDSEQFDTAKALRESVRSGHVQAEPHVVEDAGRM